MIDGEDGHTPVGAFSEVLEFVADMGTLLAFMHLRIVTSWRLQLVAKLIVSRIESNLTFIACELPLYARVTEQFCFVSTREF